MPPSVRPFKLSALARQHLAQPHHRPRQYFGGGRQLPALVPDSCLDMGLLASFAYLMQRHGHSVSRQRMRYDRVYAFERIAVGHRQDDAALRQLCALLFEVYTGCELV